MTIQNKIREMRLNRNVTQEELAQSLKVSRQTIIAIEKGNYTPSLALAFDVAKFFKVTVEEIFYVK
jgi:putative transcriptional regulator